MIYVLRHTCDQDIEAVLSLYREAAAQLKQIGIDQWQNGYPNKESLVSDIRNHVSYVFEEAGVIVGTAMISKVPEPTYETIEGAWHRDGAYLVVHRFCVRLHPPRSGYASAMFAKIVKDLKPDYIRIDTHPDNIPMRGFLEKCGFIEAGSIRLTHPSDTNALRIAYDCILTERE